MIQAANDQHLYNMLPSIPIVRVSFYSQTDFRYDACFNTLKAPDMLVSGR